MLLAVAVVVSGLASVVGYFAVSRGTKYYSSRKHGGYNCCEFCGAGLPRDPDQTWRYAGACDRCGRIQTWATV